MFRQIGNVNIKQFQNKKKSYESSASNYLLLSMSLINSSWENTKSTGGFPRFHLSHAFLSKNKTMIEDLQ